MWSTALAIVACVVPWHAWSNAPVPWTGIPMALAALGLAWWRAWLPPEVYAWETAAPWSAAPRAGACIVVLDVLQCAVHRATHRGWLGDAVRRSHAKHHEHRRPTAAVAFDTGPLDAVVQLLIPLWATLWLVRPGRGAATLFGLAYSQWLLLIHAADVDERWIPWFMASPSYHRVHHAHPDRHFAHVLRIG